MDEESRMDKKKQKYFGKIVNVFDLLLQNLNVYLSSQDGESTIMGYCSQ